MWHASLTDVCNMQVTWQQLVDISAVGYICVHAVLHQVFSFLHFLIEQCCVFLHVLSLLQ